jgi:hypothetical protein
LRDARGGRRVGVQENDPRRHHLRDVGDCAQLGDHGLAEARIKNYEAFARRV